MIKIRIYACGGAGTNIVSQISAEDAAVCYIDTSGANLTQDMNLDNVYRIEGLNGSGGNRRENYHTIAKEIAPILERFPAGDFNIVVHSASGGSGSTIGPLVMKALLEQKAATVCVVIGADDSAIRVGNTINTLKSLESISLLTEQPVVMSYHENTSGVPRGSIDTEARYVLEALIILASQENRELDGQDVTNWVQYHKVSPVRPQLSFLNVHDSRQEAAKVVEPISVASLYDDPSKDNPFGTPHNSTVGFTNGETQFGDQLHFVINIADVEENFNRLRERHTELNRHHSSYRQRKAMVDVDDALNGDGMVL